MSYPRKNNTQRILTKPLKNDKIEKDEEGRGVKKMSTDKGKSYSDEFKLHIVSLVEAGQKPGDIGKEYSISVTAIRNWVKNYGNSGSFKRKDNMSEIEKENSELKKLVKQQQMELDILKKAMALMLKS